MNKKFNVSEIQKILGLSDSFQRIDLNKHEVESIGHLLEPFLDDCQNDSPELKEMVELCKRHKGIMECYIVETSRPDTRFSCEGIVFPKLDNEEMMFISNDYHHADEFYISSNSDGTFRIRLWWD